MAKIVKEKVRNFRQLNVWTKGMEIAKDVYAIIGELPEFEKYGLRIQLAKSAVSIPSNIAEGCGKSSDRDFKRYLEISLGSAYELETQVILAANIYGIDSEELIASIQNQQKMIVSLLKKT